MAAQTITLRDCNRFFMPLIFTAELLFISHSVIHAFLARLENPRVTLAAFSIAFTINSTLGSPLWTLPQVAISYITDKRSILRQVIFALQVGAIPFLLMMLLAWTSLGDWFYGDLTGASPEAVRQAKEATFFQAFIFFAVIGRNIFSGLIMINRRTTLITLSTVVRLTSLAAFLILLPMVLSGAAVGGAALMGCIAVDAAFTVWAGRHFYQKLPAVQGVQPSYRSLWRFSVPLMMNQFSESTMFLVLNLFLGRLARPDLALASFGVMRGIVMLVLGPLRNLSQASQTLTRTREDLRVMLRFMLRITVAFMVLVSAIFLTPVRGWVLDGVMGLTPELSAYTAPALGYSVVVAFFWGLSSVFRGLVMSTRRTASMAPTAALRLIAVIGVGSLTLVFSDINGAVVGIWAMAATFAVESLVLGWVLFLGPGVSTAFPSHQAETAPEKE